MYEIGFDGDYQRIFIPVRHKDGTLAGGIGRATQNVDFITIPITKYFYFEKRRVRVSFNRVKPNPRYFYYWNFDKSKCLYPIHLFKHKKDRSIIICEGAFDAMYLRKAGFTNALALLGSKISKTQIQMILDLDPSRIISFLDNDKAGHEGHQILVNKLKNIYDVYRVQYPSEKYNDPGNLDKSTILEMVEKASMFQHRSIDRLV
jgi:5S rRNA maturation endonuclease (ribonuclease M5)